MCEVMRNDAIDNQQPLTTESFLSEFKPEIFAETGE